MVSASSIYAFAARLRRAHRRLDPHRRSPPESTATPSCQRRTGSEKASIRAILCNFWRDLLKEEWKRPRPFARGKRELCRDDLSLN